MGRIIPILILIALTIYCAVEVAQADSWAVRHAPKWLWAIIVIFLPGIGPIAWLAFGRPGIQDHPRNRFPSIPPDDDDDFLRRL